MSPRRLVIALSALLLGLGVAACGNHHPHTAGGQQTGHNTADANNNGGYVDAGPITYQLQISRELNQYGVEDSQYLKGLPASVAPQLGPTYFWYGVFLWGKNQSAHPQTTTDNFIVVDSQGNIYRPVRLDPQANPFAWTARTLQPNETQPIPNSVASEGPTQGGLLLFKVSDAVYSNRPLTLYILGAGDEKLGSISLNL
ncbi:MAG: hypothetical protein ACJ780_13890 [Solirubrobacteraceae bacterium]